MGTTCMGQSVLPNPRSCVLNRGVLHLISFLLSEYFSRCRQIKK